MTALIERKTLEETLQGNEDKVVVRPDFRNMVNGQCLTFTCNVLGINAGNKYWLRENITPLKNGETSRKGDVVVYFKSEIDADGLKGADHYGVCLGDGRVISKWGGWNVIEHPWDFSIFGDNVQYFRVDNNRLNSNLQKYGYSQEYRQRFKEMVFRRENS